VKFLAVSILGLLFWFLEAWTLMLAFGIFHHELGWQPHPGYWSSFWLSFAIAAVGSIFRTKYDDEVRKAVGR
jgi:hypothetical protein